MGILVIFSSEWSFHKLEKIQLFYYCNQLRSFVTGIFSLFDLHEYWKGAFKDGHQMGILSDKLCRGWAFC